MMNLEAIGTTLVDRYRLDSLLGQGAMGCVFASWDLVLDRPVAVKLIRQEHLGKQEFVRRFVREAKIIAQLASNPHILTIYDLCYTENGCPFLVTEYLRGRSLKASMRDKYLPSRTWVLEAGVQVAVALLAVHRHGVTHRDIKPSNIFLVEAPALSLLAKLIDFGLAQSPQFAAVDGASAGSIAGTIKYLAPEVISGDEPTPAADIYSFGLTLYELATGGYPYPASSTEEILAAHLQLAPMTFAEGECAFPGAFQTLVMQMLSKTPGARPSTERCLQGLRQANRELDEAKAAASNPREPPRPGSRFPGV
jgi:serine/threonine-protein kinase